MALMTEAATGGHARVTPLSGSTPDGASPGTDAPDPVREALAVAWTRLPRLLVLDAWAAVALLLLAGCAYMVPVLTPPLAVLLGGPVAAAVCCCTHGLLSGEAPAPRRFAAVAWQERRAGWRVSTPVVGAATLLWLTLLAHGSMPPVLGLGALVLNAAATGTALVAAMPALALATARGLRGVLLWRTALACVAASPLPVLGVLALPALAIAALPLMGPFPLLLTPALVALLASAVTGHVAARLTGRAAGTRAPGIDGPGSDAAALRVPARAQADHTTER
ncbi:hypothetical protein G4Z16_01685 [Streptomyces bathyalis]|uniref:Uncharacterized protein n=1 Tax=Streptomyces bathyalis TaxID=2710756 RepID=A0A7T1T2R7_9ACTN|nr:hypothetical protein [Streptomyces bathyalis]QPP05312.1 hypothetical protein G4Z16_01685 [Streptomyces bathyalis]